MTAGKLVCQATHEMDFFTITSQEVLNLASFGNNQ